MNKTVCFILCLLASVSLFAEDSAVEARFETGRGVLVFELDLEGAPLSATNFICLVLGTHPESIGTPFYKEALIYQEVANTFLFFGTEENAAFQPPLFTLPLETGKGFGFSSPGRLAFLRQYDEMDATRFFLTLKGDSSLDASYIPFGKLIEGEEVLKKLRPGDAVVSLTLSFTGDYSETDFTKEAYFSAISQENERQDNLFRRDNPEIALFLESLGDGVIKTDSGIYYKTLVSGEGLSPVEGDKAEVHYTGWFANGEQFNSTHETGSSVQINVGKGYIISGWLEMLTDMKIGEKRIIVLPPELAYGESGYNIIPPDSWLIFEIELLGIN